MKKVLIITGDAKKVEGFAHEQRYRFKRDKMTAELKDAEPDGKTIGDGGEGGDTKEPPKEDGKDVQKDDTKDAPKEDGKEVKKEDKKASKTDKK